MMEPRDSSARQTSLREYALLAPRLLRLLGRLMRDPRVPPRSKAVLVVCAAYLVSPVDVMPDFLPGVGRLDDIVLIAVALDHLLKQVPDHVLLEHWDGDEDVLEVLRNIVEIGASLLPRWAKRLLPG